MSLYNRNKFHENTQGGGSYIAHFNCEAFIPTSEDTRVGLLLWLRAAFERTLFFFFFAGAKDSTMVTVE